MLQQSSDFLFDAWMATKVPATITTTITAVIIDQVFFDTFLNILLSDFQLLFSIIYTESKHQLIQCITVERLRKGVFSGYEGVSTFFFHWFS